MNNSTEPLAINYLGIRETAEVKSIVEHQFSRLRQVCNSIQACKVKLVNVAHGSTRSIGQSYLISISLHLAQGVELYSLRQPSGLQDSITKAIADVFAQIFRQLIELQVEEKHLLHS